MNCRTLIKKMTHAELYSQGDTITAWDAPTDLVGPRRLAGWPPRVVPHYMGGLLMNKAQLVAALADYADDTVIQVWILGEDRVLSIVETDDDDASTRFMAGLAYIVAEDES